MLIWFSYAQGPVPNSWLAFLVHRMICILILVRCHRPPIWPPALLLNLTYIFIFLLVLSLVNLPYTNVLHSRYQISYPYSIAKVVYPKNPSKSEAPIKYIIFIFQFFCLWQTNCISVHIDIYRSPTEGGIYVVPKRVESWRPSADTADNVPCPVVKFRNMKQFNIIVFISSGVQFSDFTTEWSATEHSSTCHCIK
jgi:hypothetical protein